MSQPIAPRSPLPSLLALVALPFAIACGSPEADVADDDPGATEDAVSEKTGVASSSAERRKVMESLRAVIKPRLKGQDIVFDVSQGRYRPDGDWVFMLGKIRVGTAGRPVDYRGTDWQEAIDDGVFDDHFSALLRKQGGEWRVVAWEVGASDAAYTTWPSQHGAPKTIVR